MRAFSAFSFAPYARGGVGVALFLAISVFGCFKEPKLDVTQPRHCQSDKSCPYGYVCGPDGFCCASSDGKTCSGAVSTGGAGALVDGSLGDVASVDAPRPETGAGSGGARSEVEPAGGGAGGAAGSGGNLDAYGTGGGGQRDSGLDSPLGGEGGGSDGGGAGAIGSGGVTGTGGTNGSGGVVVTGGTNASGGVTGTGGIGTGGIGTGGIGTGGIGSGGTGTGGTTVTCGSSQKPCNGTCIPITSCCGGCGGNTPICDNGTCVGRPNGDACTPSAAAECLSGVCADGVCCNVTCDGQCEACNTTASKGTCVPTTTQRTPCTSDGSSCGGTCDGTAAHREACYYPPSSSVCGAASCNGTTKILTHARYCSGDGRCNAATTDPCPMGCATDGSAQCATSCPAGTYFCSNACVESTDLHCGADCLLCAGTSNPKCYNGTCVQCIDNSTCSTPNPVCNTSTHTCVQCTTDGNCASSTPRCVGNTCVQCTPATQSVDCPALGYGTGSTCSGDQCHCRGPSPGNLLQNPGFESSLSSWNLVSPSYVSHAGDDADSCVASGSAHVSAYGFEFGKVNQCVAVSGDHSYNFGYKYKQVATDPDALECILYFYQGGGCAGDDWTMLQIYSGAVPPIDNWGSKTTTVSPPTGTGSILVECQGVNFYDGWFDQVYLNGSGGYY
ncbi:MAG: hypothetical protein JXP73_03905 [Deltaproteobacteria bacterium]|nr:hypothetical protein [Deltaproteobacteria bacterium]